MDRLDRHRVLPSRDCSVAAEMGQVVENEGNYFD